jgi:hypothetical protein
MTLAILERTMNRALLGVMASIVLFGGEAEGYAAAFTPDGVFNTMTGHDALVGFAKMCRDACREIAAMRCEVPR